MIKKTLLSFDWRVFLEKNKKGKKNYLLFNKKIYTLPEIITV
jgi:hypothetical protein